MSDPIISATRRSVVPDHYTAVRLQPDRYLGQTNALGRPGQDPPVRDGELRAVVCAAKPLAVLAQDVRPSICERQILVRAAVLISL